MDKAEIVGELPLAITRMSVAVANVEGGISGKSDPPYLRYTHHRTSSVLRLETGTVTQGVAAISLTSTVELRRAKRHPDRSNHLEDTFQGFFNVLPTIERTKTEIAFSSRAKSAAGGSDDVSFA